VEDTFAIFTKPSKFKSHAKSSQLMVSTGN